MRCILFIIIGSIYAHSALALNPVSINYFQDTLKAKKIKPRKKVKANTAVIPHKGKPVSPQKSSTGAHTKKSSAHPRKKNVGIDHHAPDQSKNDSIIRAKNKEKFKQK